MIPLAITLNLDEAPWRDLAEECADLGTIERIGRLPRGTVEGSSVVIVQVRMGDGKRYTAQTTLALLRNAMVAIETREKMEKTAEGN